MSMSLPGGEGDMLPLSVSESEVLSASSSIYWVMVELAKKSLTQNLTLADQTRRPTPLHPTGPRKARFRDDDKVYFYQQSTGI